MLIMAVTQWLLRTPPLTLVLVAAMFFVGALISSGPKLFKARKKLWRLKQAVAGERAVAEYLDLLREDGTRVLHDLVGDSFNLDHVVVSERGIYTIETKTISKPVSGNARILFDGERILIGKYEPSRNPVTQAKAQASWLRNLLKNAMGRDYSIRPVVVFPGWFVERIHKGHTSPVWVLEPKALQAFIQQEPRQLNATEVAEVTYFLKRYIRATPEGA